MAINSVSKTGQFIGEVVIDGQTIVNPNLRLIKSVSPKNGIVKYMFKIDESGVPEETYFILTENGDIITDENGNQITHQ